MGVIVVTGSGGLIGGEATRYFARLGYDVIGIDNDMRSTFFGGEASTAWNVERLQHELGRAYRHQDVDVRDRDTILGLFSRLGEEIALVIHAAAQPSHDWAARDPFTDFDINAGGTLNLLEATRRHAPAAVFIFCSTNKVYGDRPNRLPLHELDRRYEIDPTHPYARGIGEDMSVDACLHSLFGASKLAADVLVQEYGRYFEMRTACFRGGTLTGPGHSATELHGFLAYVMRCIMTGTPYTVHGYKGKQVRDAIHSSDLIRAFHQFLRAPSDRRGLQHRRGALQQLLRPGGHRPGRGDRPAGGSSGRTPTGTERVTTSGGSATTAGSRSTTPDGSWSTTSRGSCRRSTRLTASGGRREGSREAERARRARRCHGPRGSRRPCPGRRARASAARVHRARGARGDDGRG